MPDIDPAIADQLRRAAVAVRDMHQKLETEQARNHAPVAIIGMGCRLPGAADLEAYWTLLQNGVDAIRKVPADYWDVDALYDPDPDAPGKMSTQWGGFIDDVDRFDAGFFEISPREARSMDPQHRLLLQTAWRAFEDAALPVEYLPKTKTGVYVGISTNDYANILSERAGADWIDAHASLGNSVAVAAGRLAYFFDLQGPAVSVDTACSSSLVALHQAVRALRWGEIDVGVAAGVNLCLSPELTIGFSKARMMAADGRCKTFDAAADGYVRGEGCGVVVLKRLDDALRDGDRIRAVVLGTAVNQDGRSNGLTAPNGPSQTAVIRAALDDAQKTPADVTMIEAHGTGTALGDPVEVGALGAVFAGASSEGPYLASVKTNIGHLEAAAGIAGVIKSALALEHRTIPPHLHFRDLNPMIDSTQFPFRIPVTTEPIAPDVTEPVAGVSSFGFSGTNAHVVLGAAPSVAPSDVTDGPVILALSAHSSEALETIREAVLDDLATRAMDLTRYATTLSTGRTTFRHRVAITAKDTAQARDALMSADPIIASETARIGFLFTGQGSQYAGMARGLMNDSHFRQTIARCDDVLDGLVGRILGGGDLPAGRTDVVQPLLVALEFAIADLWRARGVTPAAVIGHSVGEIAAAAFAGVMTLEDALRFVAERGRLMESCAGQGSMAAALAPADQVAQLIQGTGAVIAGYNAPSNTVISGTNADLAKASATLETNGIMMHPLEVATAFHSPVLDPVLDQIRAAAERINFNRAKISIFANLTGHQADVFDAEYWRAQAASPVRFMEGLRQMASSGLDVFLEVGPHPVLAGLGARILPQARFIPSLKRGMADQTVMTEAATSLFMAGIPIDLRTTASRRTLKVPGHPMRRDRYWPDDKVVQTNAAPVTFAGAQESGLLLGHRLDMAAGDPVFQKHVSIQSLPFLVDHVVFGAVVVPGAMLAVMGTTAVGGPIEDLVFEAPMQVPEGGLSVQITHSKDGLIEIHAKSGDSTWLRHSSAQTGAQPPSPQADLDLLALETDLNEDEGFAGQFYDDLGERGIVLGPAFRGIQRLWRGDGQAMAEILQPDMANLGALIHPAALDACFQILGATFASGGEGEAGGFLPLSVDKVTFHQAIPTRFRCHATITSTPGSPVAVGNFQLSNLDGKVLGTIEGLQIKRVTAPAAEDPIADMMLGVEWVDSPMAAQDWANPVQLAHDLDDHLATLKPLPETGLSDGLDALAAHHAQAALQAVNADQVSVGLSRLYARLPTLAAQPDQTSADALRAKFPENHAEIDLVDRCGHALADVLCGCRDAVDVLDLGTEGIYSGAGLAERANSMAARAIATAAKARGVDHFSILEVGAGTGATTRAVLHALPGSVKVDYLFTDVSDGFLTAAADTFADHNVRFARFDLERDPSLQGIKTQSFDAVLAANVIHATQDVSATLEMVHQVLMPGGLLALVESTYRQDWWDIVFGLTEGWWRFEDIDLRPEHALLDVPHWQEILTKNGFGDAIGIGADSKSRQSVILAQTLPSLPVFVVYEGRNGLSKRVATDTATVLVQRGWQAEALTTKAALKRLDKLDACSVLYTGGLSADHTTALKAAFDLTRMLMSKKRGGIGFVTRGVHTEKSDETHIDGAVLSGFGKVLAQEHAEIGAHCIDINPQDRNAAAQLADSVASLHNPDRDVLWQSGTRKVARLAQRTLPALTNTEFDPNGSYLITGAFGGLGRYLASWLADRGARHLMLTGRALPDLAVQAELSALAPDVTLTALDVTDAQAISQAVKGAENLKGVFHLAGSVADGAIISQDWDRYAAILPAKARAALHLDALTRDLDLDHFVLFSTSAALIGNPGQSNHAAANAVLDALARQRQNAGLPGLSVNWGAFDQAGAVVDRGQLGQMAARGVKTMPLRDGFDAMQRAISEGVPNIGVVSLDWPGFMAGLNGVLPPFLENFRQIATPEGPRETTTIATDVIDFAKALAEMAPQERAEGLAVLVANEAAAVLGMQDAKRIDRDQALNELGLDSLLALELRNRLGIATGKKRSATLLFDHPSVNALALNLSAELLDDAPSTAPTTTSAQDQQQRRFEDEVQAMSDAEIEALLEADFTEAMKH